MRNILGLVTLVLVVLACLILSGARRGYAKPELPDPTQSLAPRMDMRRLDPPPLPKNPTQADIGAQRYWLHCQPCHGDQGQGLTNEWRAQYPPEEQNCWQTGCHGSSPSPKAFILPTTVPPLIGPATLQRFATAADLHTFLQAAMPYQTPGRLTADDYWALTAFLLRARGLPDAAFPLPGTAQLHLLTLHPLTWPSTPAPPSLRPTDWLGWSLGGLTLAGIVVLSRLWSVRHISRRSTDRHTAES